MKVNNEAPKWYVKWFRIFRVLNRITTWTTRRVERITTRSQSKNKTHLNLRNKTLNPSWPCNWVNQTESNSSYYRRNSGSIWTWTKSVRVRFVWMDDRLYLFLCILTSDWVGWAGLDRLDKWQINFYICVHIITIKKRTSPDEIPRGPQFRRRRCLFSDGKNRSSVYTVTPLANFLRLYQDLHWRIKTVGVTIVLQQCRIDVKFWHS